MHEPDATEVRETLNYTVVALVGMLAGFIVGAVYGGSSRDSHPNATPPVPHPREIEAAP